MRALVAMSGGVDSSVAAALMIERGYDVVGVTLKQWEGADGQMPVAGCCTLSDAEDARRVAAVLDIPYYVLDYVEEFTKAVVDPFGEGYLAGLTPNPCIECNRNVRFNALLDRVQELDCDVLVTGHHARVENVDGGYRLRKGADPGKDQSYVLSMLGQAELARTRFPVGELTKDETRRIASDLGLRTALKPDSQDICFVGDDDYRAFVRRHAPEAVRPVTDFTIGQRRKLGIAVGEPRYVVGIDASSATVTIGAQRDLEVDRVALGDVAFVAGRPPADRHLVAQVRYKGGGVPARLEEDSEGWSVVFDAPVVGVAPGQTAVLYRGDEVLGGGRIERTAQDSRIG